MFTAIFVTVLASGLAVMPKVALAQNAKGNSAARTPPVIVWHTAGAITVPFEYFRQHIYVTVSINGKPGYVFMLDSGANRNILNLRTARQMGMKLQKLDQASDIGFGRGRIYVGPQEYVDAEIDSVPVAHSMAVLDLNRFEQHFRHPTDGMLGYPFFRRFVIKVDFQAKLLTFLPPEKYRYRGLGVPLRLMPSDNFVAMPVTVVSSRFANHEVNVVVDTGSSVTLILYQRFVRALDLESSYQRAQAGEAFGLNGYYPVEIGSIDSLQLGNAETRNLPMEYLQDEEEVGAERDIPGAIGNGILESFRAVIFDVPHRRMFFEINPPAWQSGLQRSETFGP